jgi:hypothetical protein
MLLEKPTLLKRPVFSERSDPARVPENLTESLAKGQKRAAALRLDWRPMPAASGAPVVERDAGSVVKLGPGLDALLPHGGLEQGALHEVTAETLDGAAFGFIAGLARRFAGAKGVVLCCGLARACRENGFPYGPGLARFGLEPERFLIVEAGRTKDLLWAIEEGLRGGCTVIGEVSLTDGSPELSFALSRRLALAAAARGSTALLLSMPAPRLGPSAAQNRWRVAAAGRYFSSPNSKFPTQRIPPIQSSPTRGEGNFSPALSPSMERKIPAARLVIPSPSMGEVPHRRRDRTNLVAPSPSMGEGGGMSRACATVGSSPAFAVELWRHRLGRPGRWILAWDEDALSFRLLAPLADRAEAKAASG